MPGVRGDNGRKARLPRFASAARPPGGTRPGPADGLATPRPTAAAEAGPAPRAGGPAAGRHTRLLRRPAADPPASQPPASQPPTAATALTGLLGRIGDGGLFAPPLAFLVGLALPPLVLFQPLRLGWARAQAFATRARA
ncbi:hypothetical protein [Falsiroseomonas sp.]|uniref:hypothetical protein n=1 Tax=Falsiroseomonas sp. TaxID=2870721 RepID=UPI003F727A56